MIIKKIIICVFLLLVLSGCAKEENPYDFDTTPQETSTTESITTTDNVLGETTTATKISEGLSMKYYSAGEGMAEKLGVDKTLVFVTYYITTRGVDPRIFEIFNELLVNKYGCDFAVEFRGYDFVSNEKLYQEEIREMKELNVQTDILCVGQLYGVNKGDAYGDAIRDGLLEPLGSWFKTEWGKVLKEAYPTAYWERVTRDGECYGNLRGYTSVASAVTVMNDKYISGEVSDIKTIDDLLDYVKKVKDVDEDVVPLAVDDTAFNIFNGYYDFNFGNFYGISTMKGAGIYAKKVDGKWKAFFSLENEEYINNLMKIREYSFVNGVDSATAIDTGKFVAAISYARVRDFDNNAMIVYEKKNGKIETEMKVTVGDVLPDWYEVVESNVTGIASWSEYKEEAIHLLALIASEPELANLLTYGLEGIHYEVVDGKVNWLEYDGSYGSDPIWADSIANMHITYPCMLETENKEQRYKEIEDSAELGVKSLYNMDVSEYKESLIEMAKLMTKYDGWLYADNYMELLDEQRKQMKELGIDKIVEEINRQLAEAQK